MCYQPITIKTEQGYRQVPCGKCLECLRKYQSDWSNRMYEELKAHDGKAVFFTLTYDENNVPKNYLYYATPTDYEIFRSPSDYGYDNTYIDEKGREKVLPSCKGQRKHHRVDPAMELRETGLDPKIIDFNVRRKEHEKFRDIIQNIYGNYLRTITAPPVYVTGCTDDTDDIPRVVWDFDAYDGDLFLDTQELEEDCGLVCDLFTEALNDDDYVEEDKVQDMVRTESPKDDFLAEDVVSRCEKVFGGFRERPVMMFNSVRKKDLQDWIKRGRDKLSRQGKEFTFFITSEYGPRTLRPHYHGVLFGVTAEEAMCMCKDWQKHHGERIQWENVDLSKGDMSYCAKYCSKGFYEHPLCSKDFFYRHPVYAEDGTLLRPFTEYHSKHYERCMEIFGIDAPIVDPTFHLISKGFGIKWVDDHKDEILRYEDELNAADYVISGATIKTHCIVAPWDELFSMLPDSMLDEVGFKEYDIETNITRDKTKEDYEEVIKRFFDGYKYFRTYKKAVVAYGVPKYYRAKTLSDGLRAAFTNYVQQINVELYQQKFDQLRASFGDGEDAEILSMLEKQEIQEKVDRMTNCKEKIEKIYNKSKI